MEVLEAGRTKARDRPIVLVLALLGAVLALLGLAAPRHSRHALRNDHGIDLHTEAASHVVRRTERHAIGQLGVSCASAGHEW